MFTDKLFEKVLTEPNKHGATTLFIVSGYASPAIIYKHLNIAKNVSVQLIIGMASKDGIKLGFHKNFQRLVLTDFPGRFSCKYSTSDIPAHLKLYSWYKGTKPYKGFAGSANYSQPAFSEKQLEVMVECSPSTIKKIFDKVLHTCIDCCDPKVDDYIFFYEQQKTISPKGSKKRKTFEQTTEKQFDIKSAKGHITLSLLTKQGIPGTRSGLNWGQRPGRNGNEAYIPIPVQIMRSGFFPPARTHFILLTDDDESLDCTIEQGGEKAITTYKNNSLLGEYFRKRMGVPNKRKVNLADFNKYGRSYIDVYKIDDITYYLVFSK